MYCYLGAIAIMHKKVTVTVVHKIFSVADVSATHLDWFFPNIMSQAGKVGVEITGKYSNPKG